MNQGIRTIATAIVLVVATAAHAADDAATKQKRIERGKYLVDMIGCHDCHSPKNFTPEGIPVPDMTKAFSGYSGMKLPAVDAAKLAPGNWYLMAPDLTAYAGPWGITYAANITPDEQTGIGLWTDDIFVKAMRTGLHMGAGRHILPPMPWTYYKNATDEDLKAMFAYLMSMPAIKNAVPAPVAMGDVGKK